MKRFLAQKQAEDDARMARELQEQVYICSTAFVRSNLIVNFGWCIFHVSISIATATDK